jgi:exodeoxyribonuclease VII large subunit
MESIAAISVLMNFGCALTRLRYVAFAGVRIATNHRHLQRVAQRLQRTTNVIILERQARLIGASARLEALSPLAVLSRGYALVYDADGRLLRSAKNTAVGNTIHTRLAVGTLEARVTSTQAEETDITENRNS